MHNRLTFERCSLRFMTKKVDMPAPVGSGDVVLITHADSDSGYCYARLLLDAGYRVVVTARIPAKLTRILLGRRDDQVIALASDPDDAGHRRRLLQRAQARSHRVTIVLDGRSGRMNRLCDSGVASDSTHASLTQAS